jgi:glycosyltransferase involved in cell wall biosynthesis
MRGRVAYCEVPKLAGVYTFAVNLAAHLPRLGYELRLVGVGPQAKADYARSLSLLPAEILAPAARDFESQRDALVGWLRRESIDIVMISGSETEHRLVPALPPSVRVVSVVNNATRGHYRVATYGHERMHRVVCVSPRLQRDIIRWCGVPAEKVELIPYGIDVEAYARAGEKETQPAAFSVGEGGVQRAMAQRFCRPYGAWGSTPATTQGSRPGLLSVAPAGLGAQSGPYGLSVAATGLGAQSGPYGLSVAATGLGPQSGPYGLSVAPAGLGPQSGPYGLSVAATGLGPQSGPYGLSVAATGLGAQSGPYGLRLVYLGRMFDAPKGIFLIPKILKRLERAGVSFHLTVIGDGPDVGRFAARMTAAGLAARWTHRGAMRYDAVPAELARHDVQLLPSRHEGLPLTLLEGMAAGCVPVASRLSGITDYAIATSEQGFLCRVGRAADFASAICELAADRARLRRMSAAAADRVRREFTSERMAQRYARLFDAILAEPRSAAWSARSRRPGVAEACLASFRRALPAPVKNAVRATCERMGWTV